MRIDGQDQNPGMQILQTFEASNATSMPKGSIMSTQRAYGLTLCLLNISQANNIKVP